MLGHRHTSTSGIILTCEAERGHLCASLHMVFERRCRENHPRVGLSDKVVAKSAISLVIFRDERDYGIICVKSAAFVQVSRRKSGRINSWAFSFYKEVNYVLFALRRQRVVPLSVL